MSYIQHLYPFFYHSRLTFCLTGASDSLQSKLEIIILCYLSGSFISVLKINLTEWLWWQHTIISPPPLLVVLPYLLSISIIFVDLWVTWSKEKKKRNRWWKSKHFKNIIILALLRNCQEFLAFMFIEKRASWWTKGIFWPSINCVAVKMQGGTFNNLSGRLNDMNFY